MTIHSMQPTDRAQDGQFADALLSSGVKTRALREEWLPSAHPRARRYAARMILRYRALGQAQWFQGVTEDLSRTGLLFRSGSDSLPLRGTELELILEVARRTLQGLPARVEARGKVTRVTWDVRLPEMLPGVAVTLKWHWCGLLTRL